MKTIKISLQNLKGKLSRSEMKNIMAGTEPVGCGTGISCEGKTEYQECGTKGCSCITVQGGGENIYYCRSDA